MTFNVLKKFKNQLGNEDTNQFLNKIILSKNFAILEKNCHMAISITKDSVDSVQTALCYDITERN